jgi:hypothetical protein
VESNRVTSKQILKVILNLCKGSNRSSSTFGLSIEVLVLKKDCFNTELFDENNDYNPIHTSS